MFWLRKIPVYMLVGFWRRKITLVTTEEGKTEPLFPVFKGDESDPVSGITSL